VNSTTRNSSSHAAQRFRGHHRVLIPQRRNDWLGIGNQKPGTRAIPAADPNNRLEYMKAIVQTANVEGETIPLKEVIPFWFAVSSPLLGMLLGLLGAWFVTWVST
jgi:hypothetical protein